MALIGAIINAVAILIGGSMGLLLKKGLPKHIGDSILNGMALCVLYIGISGSLKGENLLISILSIGAGAIAGELLRLDDRLNALGQFLQDKFAKEGQEGAVAEGFVTASLLFCVGAMAIVGSLQSGLMNNHDTLFAKSLIDGITAIVFASSLGFGVLFSSILILIYEGGITLLASFLSPLLTTTVINEMTCVGSLLIMGIGLNMLGMTKIKVINYIPAVFLPILLCKFI